MVHVNLKTVENKTFGTISIFKLFKKTKLLNSNHIYDLKQKLSVSYPYN